MVNDKHEEVEGLTEEEEEQLVRDFELEVLRDVMALYTEKGKEPPSFMNRLAKNEL